MTWQPIGSYDTARDLYDLLTPHLKPGHVASPLEVRDGLWGFSVHGPVSGERLTADCGCILVIDEDIPPCAICGGCEEHCECVCGQHHPYRAQDECTLCVKTEEDTR